MRRPHLGQPADCGAPGQCRAAMAGRAASSRRHWGWAVAPALALFASCLDGLARIFRPSEHEGAGGRAAAGWLTSRATIQGSAMKNCLAAVAVFILAAGSVGLAAPGALAVTHSAGSAVGKVVGTSGHTGVRSSPSPSPAASGPGWSIVPSPNPLAPTGQLVGVSCSSSSSCTAVGDYTKRFGSTVTLAERWNGTRWSTEPTPNPEGAPSSTLNAVDCTSASACVAVGNSFTHSGTDITLAERWDGTKWSIQATPNPSSGGGMLFGVSCSSASACTAVGASNAGTLAERWNGTKWLIQPTPNPVSGGGALFGVACPSSSVCVSAGGSNSGTLAERWNGSRWVTQPTPNPTGAQASDLFGVDCASSLACEAVGFSINRSGTGVNLAERWNGTNWVIQPTPNPPGSQFGFLNGVSCTSSPACEAVGPYANSSGINVTLAVRWNGTKWSIQPTPNRTRASASGFIAVSCPLSSFCMAAGPSANSFSTPVSLAESWNGNHWKIQNTPNLPGAEPSGLIGVSCPSPSSCMAVGGTGIDNSPRRALVAERWNGNGWGLVPVPNPPGMTPAGGNLESVSCTGPSACMAVGAYANSSGQPQPLSERWNGTRWSVVPIPHLPDAQATLLNSVACTSASACTAVAAAVNASGTRVTLAERWNGTRWSIQPTPNPAGTRGAELSGVDCTGPSTCTAVGAAVDSAGDPVGPTLAERWNGTKWSIQPTPNPSSPGGGTLTWVACPSPSACTAVGASVDTSGNPVATLAERWNGSGWSIQPTPNPAGVQGVRLEGVACTSPSACTAVGGSFADASLAERWNGTKWVIQASPNPVGPIYDLMLWTVACPWPLHCMAVGKYASLAPQLTLAEQWNGSSENAQPAVKVSETPTASGLACLRVQHLIMKGFRVATSSAARFGTRRGPSTRPAWMTFLPQCRGT